jgi:sensor histidine kinase YesM
VIFFNRLYQGLNDYGFTIDNTHGNPDLLLDNLLPQLAITLTTYCAFLAINFHILPHFWVAKKYLIATSTTVATFIVTGLIFTVAQSYLNSWIYNQYSSNVFIANIKFVSRGFTLDTMLFFIYAVYLLLRRAIIYQYEIHTRKQTLASQITREAVLIVGAWLLLLMIFIAINRRNFLSTFGSFYLVVLPFCFGIYLLNLYWLIPRYRKAINQGILTYTLQLTAVSLGLVFVELVVLLQFVPKFSDIGYLVYYGLIPLVITVALSWRIYLVNEEKYKQLNVLKTALGTSDANLQFLRSQINPHFLFNALNTIYGTALMEKAEKTSEGVQKLGDMMRFMLHENMQDTIPLSRDMEYLHNYIGLQNLRIASSDNINIKTDITDEYNSLKIAPMLLIPFIENAYKHGISFKNPSYIQISLQLQGNVLLLDVHNSLHTEKGNDPEQKSNGIGLENVKQRLQLLYSKKHELLIRQTKTEFFVHLTLTLS